MAVVLSNHRVGFQMIILNLCFYLITGWQHDACKPCSYTMGHNAWLWPGSLQTQRPHWDMLPDKNTTSLVTLGQMTGFSATPG